MNKSFSKIRHIQESNSRLEKRLLGEENEDLQDDRLQQIIDMDAELDNDPTYKKYEKIYTGNKLKSMLQDKMGMDLDSMSEEESEALIGMFSSMMDISKAGKTPKIDRETLLNRKESIIELVRFMEDMAAEDDEFELSAKLRDYNKLLQDYN